MKRTQNFFLALPRAQNKQNVTGIFVYYLCDSGFLFWLPMATLLIPITYYAKATKFPVLFC